MSVASKFCRSTVNVRSGPESGLYLSACAAVLSRAPVELPAARQLPTDAGREARARDGGESELAGEAHHGSTAVFYVMARRACGAAEGWPGDATAAGRIRQKRAIFAA